MKTALAVVVAGVIIAGGMYFAGSSGGNADAASVTNVSVTDGNQIVEIDAKGGYAPKLTEAKADMPTVLRMKTNGTYDCSASVVIPSLSYRKFLPASGQTDIPIPAQKSGSTLEGICAMGMYHFAVQFK